MYIMSDCFICGMRAGGLTSQCHRRYGGGSTGAADTEASVALAVTVYIIACPATMSLPQSTLPMSAPFC